MRILEKCPDHLFEDITSDSEINEGDIIYRRAYHFLYSGKSIFQGYWEPVPLHWYQLGLFHQKPKEMEMKEYEEFLGLKRRINECR